MPTATAKRKTTAAKPRAIATKAPQIIDYSKLPPCDDTAKFLRNEIAEGLDLRRPLEGMMVSITKFRVFLLNGANVEWITQEMSTTKVHRQYDTKITYDFDSLVRFKFHVKTMLYGQCSSHGVLILPSDTTEKDFKLYEYLERTSEDTDLRPAFYHAEASRLEWSDEIRAIAAGAR